MAALDPLAKFAPKTVKTQERKFLRSWRGYGIAFDQSLTSTGYVYFSFLGRDAPEFAVHEMGMIKTSPETTGWIDTLRRAVDIFQEVSQLLDRLPSIDLVLHETPPFGASPSIHRPDASIVSSVAVQCAASLHGVPASMVSANSVKHHMTGNSRADKKRVREALELKFGEALDVPTFSRNEHTFDALGIALTYVETDE